MEAGVVRHDLICVGTSAGGVSALSELVKALPGDLPAAVLVVLHLAPEHMSVLPRILSTAGRLPAHHATDGETLQQGQIYVAPPDRHLLVESGRLRVQAGARENGCRPAVDPLFRTAAWAYGPRVIGVLLTGALDDGSAGLVAVKARGGMAVVQDPEDAFCADMPRNALEVVEADYVVPLARMGSLLIRLASEEAVGVAADAPLVTREAAIALATPEVQFEPPGAPSRLSCPACGGVLNEVNDHGMMRFRCQTGHAYAPDSLIGAQHMGVESALWAALRALEEQVDLGRRMAMRARASKHPRSATRYEERALAAEEQAALIRRVLRLAGPEHQHG